MVSEGCRRARSLAWIVVIVATPPGVWAGGQSHRPRGAEADAAVSATRARVARSESPEETETTTRHRWPRVFIPDPVAGRIIRTALTRASTLLDGEVCASIVDDFTDETGHPLSQYLQQLGLSLQAYLAFVLFVDDTRSPTCSAGVIASTVPGSRVVRVCTDELKRTWQQDPSWTVAAVLHEVLHTLGLGENPPASSAITKRVLRQCQQK